MRLGSNDRRAKSDITSPGCEIMPDATTTMSGATRLFHAIIFIIITIPIITLWTAFKTSFAGFAIQISASGELSVVELFTFRRTVVGKNAFNIAEMGSK